MLMLRWGKKEVLGERLVSFLGEKSLEERERDLPCLESAGLSSDGVLSVWELKDSTKGTSTESLMSS